MSEALVLACWGLLGGGVVLLLSGCSMEKMVQERVDQMAADLAQQPELHELPKKVVSWDEAVEYALEHNLDLQRARLSVKDAEKQVSRIFKDMIPSVNLDALLTQDISNLTSVTGDDIGFHTNILFNLPSLTRIPITYYTAKATVFRAKKTLEMKEREIVSRLYKNVWMMKLGRLQYGIAKQEAEIKERNDGTVSTADKDWEAKKEGITTELIALMGNPDVYWIIDEKTIPTLSWKRYQEASRQLDNLVLTMMAMEVEASRLNIWGIRAQYFPEFNVNFYSPSLFTSTGGTYGGFFADSGDMYVNMSLSWKLDTTMSIYDRLVSAKDSHKILEKEVRVQALDRRDKVSKLMKSMNDFSNWVSYIKKRANYVNSILPLSTDEYRSNQQEVRQMYKELYSNQEKNLETEAALIMEYGLLQ